MGVLILIVLDVGLLVKQEESWGETYKVLILIVLDVGLLVKITLSMEEVSLS